ncbi:MAG: nicotinate-nucleotide--dimethylbenzimidazole phosphoribosyltransferase [Lachnospiraceae bacterium]|nr:nicotinate-nucleotide--dimethylbenzimidazole phosphoribosyltransferase [Lachnospiraceae bacterium]
MKIEEYVKKIEALSFSDMKKAQHRWDTIAKPLKSLGLLEEAVIKLAGIVGADNVSLNKPALVIMCGDHGVVTEGVTQTGSEITALVAENFEKSKTSVTVMAKVSGVDVFPIDIGIKNDEYKNKKLLPFVLCDRKIDKGTKNIVTENAMTYQQCMKAIQCGIDIIGELKAQSYDIVATGEMGIGNTTPSSAMATVLLSMNVEETTGRGAGLCDEGLRKKRLAVEKAVKRFFENGGEKKDSFKVLFSLGGYDIAGMTGLFIGGAIHKMPVVIDGFISSVSALVAVGICPTVKDYIFASHKSKEGCGEAVLNKIGLRPFINCDMCLGEGTGAVAFLPILKMAVEVYKQMCTFAEINMENYKDFEKEEN